MNEDEVKQKIIELTDRWARDVMRSDRSMNPVEQALLDAIMEYRRVLRSALKVPKKIDKLPPPPLVPRDLGQEIVTELDTLRYSDMPTVPTPPEGMPAVDIDTIGKKNKEIPLDSEIELEPITSRRSVSSRHSFFEDVNLEDIEANLETLEPYEISTQYTTRPINSKMPTKKAPPPKPLRGKK